MKSPILTRLTEAQEAQIPKIRAEWLAIGLSTNPFDPGLAEAAVEEAYRCAGLKEPRIVIHLGSPMSGAAGAGFLAQVWAQVRAQVGAQVRNQVGAQVWNQVGAQVWDQVWNQVGAQVWDQVWAQVRAQVWAQVWAQVGAQVWAQVGAQVWAQVGAQVWAQVRAQVGAQVRNQVGAQVWDQVWAQVRDQVGDQVNRAAYGGHDASWLAFYRFFSTACGMETLDAKLSGLWSTAQHCGWWWPFENAVIITPRPTQLHLDAQGRLHNLSGAALLYPDGWGIHAVHGVRVPADVIENPKSITIPRIESEENAEVRRVMVEKYGTEKFLTDSGANEVHRDDYGILYRKELPNDEPIVMVKVVNSTPEQDGSFKEYFLRVPPRIQRAKEGIAWTFDKAESEYEPAIQT